MSISYISIVLLHAIVNFSNLGADTLEFHIFCNNGSHTLTSIMWQSYYDLFC